MAASEKFWVGHILRPDTLPDRASLEYPIEKQILRRWPMHITIIPPVEGHYYPQLGLDKITQLFEPLELTTGEEAYFGKNNNVQVRLINDPEFALAALWAQLIPAIESNGHNKVDRSFGGFRPHIAKHGGKLVEEGKVLRIGGLSVVTYDENGTRKVAQNLPFEANRTQR